MGPACPLHSRINRLEARGRTLDPYEKHFESCGYGWGVVYRYGGDVGFNLIVAYAFQCDRAPQARTMGTSSCDGTRLGLDWICPYWHVRVKTDGEGMVPLELSGSTLGDFR
jgi:hypothetical protein